MCHQKARLVSGSFLSSHLKQTKLFEKILLRFDLLLFCSVSHITELQNSVDVQETELPLDL